MAVIAFFPLSKVDNLPQYRLFGGKTTLVTSILPQREPRNNQHFPRCMRVISRDRTSGFRPGAGAGCLYIHPPAPGHFHFLLRFCGGFLFAYFKKFTGFHVAKCVRTKASTVKLCNCIAEAAKRTSNLSVATLVHCNEPIFAVFTSFFKA